MSPRDWLRYATLIIWIGMILLITISAGIKLWSEYQENWKAYEEYKREAKADQRAAAESIAKQCNVADAPVAVVSRCLSEKLATYQEKEYTNKDLQAQQNMAFWALWLFVITVVGTVLSIIGVIFLFISLRQTRTAIEDNRELGEAEVRAYVGIDDFEHDKVKFRNFRPGKKPTFRCVYRNHGGSPANRLRYIAMLDIFDHPYVIVDEDIVGPPDGEDVPGITVSQNGYGIMEATSYKPIDETEYGIALANGDKRLYLSGLIYYEDVFGRFQKTRFCFYLHVDRQIPIVGGGYAVEGHWRKSHYHNDAT